MRCIKIIIFTFIIFVVMPHYTHAQSQPHTQSQPLPSSIVFSPVANPTYNYSPELLAEVNPTIICTATSLSYSIAISLRDYMVSWADKIKNSVTKDNYEILKTIINNFLWDHKYIITGSTLLGGYVTTSIIQISDYYFINDSTRWSHWKHEYNFEELCAIPHNQLTKELLFAINQRNCNNNKPTDLNHPLMLFMNSINEEICRLNRYIYITSIQKKLHIIKLFPTNETKIKRAEQLLSRAHFVKHLFLSWLTEYNIANR